MDFLSLFSYSFVVNAYLAGLCIGMLSGMLGLLLVLRGKSLIGDGLAHVSFGAIALGMVFGVYPFYIAVPVVVLASFGILMLSGKATLFGDAAIGIVSATGVAGGVLLASLAQGFNVDLFSYLFGNILAVSQTEIILAATLSLIVAILILLNYHTFFLTTFDESLAKASGVNTTLTEGLLMALTGVVVVLAIKAVGVMLVSALLIIPAVTALQFAKSFGSAMVFSAILAIFTITLGITLSFFADIPAGATIVLLSVFFFLLSLVWKRVR
ncbi:MAG: metal ABC transporter permease [Parcubacteria group bacterium]|nr:metal ABC transporter permease [Parcubacteria group bacterium]